MGRSKYQVTDASWGEFYGHEEGPPERVYIPCDSCHKPVATYWAAGHRGLLRGNYDLIGNTIWHKSCWDNWVKEYPP